MLLQLLLHFQLISQWVFEGILDELCVADLSPTQNTIVIHFNDCARLHRWYGSLKQMMQKDV